MTTTVGSVVEPWAPGGPPPGAGDAVAGRAPWQLFRQRFREDRVATVALGFIALEIILAFFAPWVVKLLGHPPNALFPEQLDPAFGTPTGPSSGSRPTCCRIPSPGSSTKESSNALNALRQWGDRHLWRKPMRLLRVKGTEKPVVAVLVPEGTPALTNDDVELVPGPGFPHQ